MRRPFTNLTLDECHAMARMLQAKVPKTKIAQMLDHDRLTITCASGGMTRMCRNDHSQFGNWEGDLMIFERTRAPTIWTRLSNGRPATRF